jgi:hypothetical protein
VNAGRGTQWMMLATAMLLFAAEVSAQGVPRPMRERGGGPQSQRVMPEARPTQFNAEGEAAQKPRMTPEERRQLRRDVHDAGRDLYPERMRERRREMRRGE